jgi:uncharacterized protein (TIGR00297 family)
MQLLFALFLIIAISTALIQWLAARFPARVTDLRKVLHVIAIVCCATATQYYPDVRLLGYLFLAFCGVLFVVVYIRLLNISTGSSLGIALFPLAFSLLLLCPQVERQQVVSAMLVLAWSDALAAAVGSRWARSYWTPLLEQKSALGSFVFWSSAYLILVWRYGYSVETLVIMAMIALLATFVEMFSWRGSDNFWIPVVVALCLQQAANGHFQLKNGFFTLGVALLVLPVLRSRRWLSVEGIFAAGFMGVLLVTFLGPWCLVFPVVFLALGSLSAKLNPKDKEVHGRNAIQVFANGGMGMLVALLVPVLPHSTILFAFVVVFTTANADTLSSEIGKYFGHATFDIAKWRAVPPGLSGGVSVAGTAAGALGSAIIAGLAYCMGWLNETNAIAAAVLGFSGMLLDSVLGSLIQAKYSIDGTIVESGDAKSLVSGWHSVNNDGVNLISIAVAVVVALFLRA